MLRRQFGQMAIALPAVGMLGAQHSSPAASSSVSHAASGSALASFSNTLNTLAQGWQAASPSGDTTGATDTGFLNTTLGSLGSGGSLWLAPGKWYVNGPITPLAGQRISGLHGATQSVGGDSGDLGTTIVAVNPPNGASWPATTGPFGDSVRAVFAYASSTLRQGEISDLWIDCSNYTASNGLCGVAAVGDVRAIGLHNVGVYKAPSHGFLLAQDSDSNVPDGWYLNTCLADSCGTSGSGDGFSGRFNDATLLNCHAQNCQGDGFMITSANAKLNGCRGDLCTNGFTIDVFGGGTYNDATVLTGCGTQRNDQSGLNVINSSSGGNSYRAPVVVDGCTFGGDGYDGGNGQTSDYNAGIRVRGVNTVLIGSASVTVHTVGGILCPRYGLSMGVMANGTASPLLVTIATGLLNGAQAPVHDNTSGTIVKFGAGVYGAVGYQPTTYTVPTP